MPTKHNTRIERFYFFTLHTRELYLPPSAKPLAIEIHEGGVYLSILYDGKIRPLVKRRFHVFCRGPNEYYMELPLKASRFKLIGHVQTTTGTYYAFEDPSTTNPVVDINS